MRMENFFFTEQQLKKTRCKKKTIKYSSENRKEKTIEFYDYYDH